MAKHWCFQSKFTRFDHMSKSVNTLKIAIKLKTYLNQISISLITNDYEFCLYKFINRIYQLHCFVPKYFRYPTELFFNPDRPSRDNRRKIWDTSHRIIRGRHTRWQHKGRYMLLCQSLDQLQSKISIWHLRKNGYPGSDWTPHLIVCSFISSDVKWPESPHGVPVNVTFLLLLRVKLASLRLICGLFLSYRGIYVNIVVFCLICW